MFGCEERARRPDGLQVLQGQLDKKSRELVAAQGSLQWEQREVHEKTRELVTAQGSLQREQGEVKRLRRSLECQICREEPWDTATGCGQLFSGECIRHWLGEDSSWREDDDGIWVRQAPRCPVCRIALSERDLKRVSV